ncbi:MAG: hypothetical protein ACPGWR_31955 [Ardenticatenaceae bacterium]
MICDLEKRAAASQQSQQNEAQSAPCRNTLLQELSEAGIFSEAYFNEKQRYLEMWHCPTLLTYQKAALEFLNHFRSQTSPAMPRSALPVPFLRVEISESPLSFPYMPKSSGE